MDLRRKKKVLAAVCAADLLLLGGLFFQTAETMEWKREGLKASVREDQLVKEAGYVALTFYDGPHKTCSEKLLDGLKERGVRATFFLMGQNIEGNEALVERMEKEGHLIGNHSYSHRQLTKETGEAVCRGVEKTNRLIEEITGDRPLYIRPPYGAWNEELENEVGLTPVLWSVDSLDWKLRNKEKIVRRVVKETEDGDIILLHDIFPSSVEAALEIVDTLTAKGYTFVTVDELLID